MKKKNTYRVCIAHKISYNIKAINALDATRKAKKIPRPIIFGLDAIYHKPEIDSVIKLTTRK